MVGIRYGASWTVAAWASLPYRGGDAKGELALGGWRKLGCTGEPNRGRRRRWPLSKPGAGGSRNNNQRIQGTSDERKLEGGGLGVQKNLMMLGVSSENRGIRRTGPLINIHPRETLQGGTRSCNVCRLRESGKSSGRREARRVEGKANAPSSGRGRLAMAGRRHQRDPSIGEIEGGVRSWGIEPLTVPPFPNTSS